jgi:hypothetical protein
MDEFESACSGLPLSDPSYLARGESLNAVNATEGIPIHPRFQRNFENSVDMFSPFPLKPMFHFVNCREHDRKQNENE